MLFRSWELSNFHILILSYCETFMFPNFQSAKISKFLNYQLYKFLDM